MNRQLKTTARSSIDSRQRGGSRTRLAGFRLLLVTAALGVAGLAMLVSGPGASGVRQSQAKLSPQAALDWNLIAVNTVRSATLTPPKFQPEGFLYMAAPRSDVNEQWQYGLGLWIVAGTSTVALEGYDAGVSFRSLHHPETDTTCTVVSNWTDGAWPLSKVLTERLFR